MTRMGKSAAFAAHIPRSRLIPEKIPACPVNTTAWAADVPSSSSRRVMCLHSSISSALTLPWLILSTAMSASWVTSSTRGPPRSCSPRMVSRSGRRWKHRNAKTGMRAARRESRGVNDRERQHDHRHCLVQQRQRRRHLMEQSQDAEARLHADADRERQCTLEGRAEAEAAPEIGEMQRGKEPERIGNHAMRELYGEDIFEPIAPQRLQVEELRCGGHEAAVDQRPGIVDEAAAKPCEQRAEIDLQHHEAEQHQRGCAAAR